MALGIWYILSGVGFTIFMVCVIFYHFYLILKIIFVKKLRDPIGYAEPSVLKTDDPKFILNIMEKDQHRARLCKQTFDNLSTFIQIIPKHNKHLY
mmetsp:Transcript_27061/g.23956  ORF Transcript_27061/g.23956 Transcript_27061/m.23956 type:complete len:95 (+) Transcript_27061:444-728(+)